MGSSILSNVPIVPFLRWTGSKRWFIDHINRFLPSKFNNYHEPFLGGGAVFFFLKNNSTENARKYFLSDSNEELINCYMQLRDNSGWVIKWLKGYVNSELDYYRIRGTEPKSDSERAARFIYLNRTSFNGIYRVNSFGKYNVPYGSRPKVDFITEDLLRGVSLFLREVAVSSYSFEKSIEKIKKNDLVFIDPPYTVAHENNGFIEYNQKLFSWEDQIRLREYINQVVKKQAFFILTNASHSSITELYSNIGIVEKLSRLSKVGGRNKTRGIFNEVVIYNTLS